LVFWAHLQQKFSVIKFLLSNIFRNKIFIKDTFAKLY